MYRIIPFVCNKSGLSFNGSYGNTTEVTAYGLRITTNEQPYLEIPAGGSASGGQVTNYTLIWTDYVSNNGYPTFNGVSHMNVPGITFVPDVGIIYSWPGFDASGGKKLKDHYFRVDLDFNVYPTDGNQFFDTYTWVNSGTIPDGNSPLLRDTQKDNVGGWEKTMLFYIRKAGWVDFDTVADMVGRFYWKDSYGNTIVDELMSTYIYPQG